MLLLVLLLVFLALNATAWRWGHDSRDGRDWTVERRPVPVPRSDRQASSEKSSTSRPRVPPASTVR
jgi:hypothetical protein